MMDQPGSSEYTGVPHSVTYDHHLPYATHMRHYLSQADYYEPRQAPTVSMNNEHSLGPFL